MPSRLDSPITLRELLHYPFSLPKMEMTYEEYMALSPGYHGNSKTNKSVNYAFPIAEKTAGYALACISVYIRYIPPRRGEEIEGGQVEFKHHLLTVNGEPLLLKPTNGKGYPCGYEVVEGPYAGNSIEYTS